MSKHVIVQDLKRVAQDLGRPPTRDEYLELGKCTQYSVREIFGTFSGALVAAGFEAEETNKKSTIDKALDKYNVSADLRDAFNKTILPYCGKYEKQTKEISRLVAASDFHSFWTDPFALYVFTETIKRIQPEIIILGGDIYDFYDVSSFSKDPSRILKLQDEIDYIKEKIFAPIRKVCPKSQIDFFIGNHEWRLFRYLCQEGRALASLKSLQFNSLFELDTFGINLVARPSMLAAKTDKQRQNYKIYHNSYVFTHGPSVSVNHAHKNLAKFNLSGSSGHMHNYQVASVTGLDGIERTWTSIGCMCLLKSGEEFIYDFIPWQQGFEVIHVNPLTRRVLKEYVQIHSGESMVGGIYYSKKDLKGIMKQ